MDSASEARKLFRTPTRILHTENGPIRLAKCAADDIVGSDGEIGRSVTSALGKRRKSAGPHEGSDGVDSSGEETKRPNKNRVTGVPSFRYSDRQDSQKTKATGL